MEDVSNGSRSASRARSASNLTGRESRVTGVTGVTGVTRATGVTGVTRATGVTGVSRASRVTRATKAVGRSVSRVVSAIINTTNIASNAVSRVAVSRVAASRVAASNAAASRVAASNAAASNAAASDNLHGLKQTRRKLNTIKPLPRKKLEKDAVIVKRKGLKHLPSTIYNPIVDWEEISSILNIPFKDIPENIMRSLLLNSFTGNYEKDLKILHDRVKEYKSIYKEYYKYIQEIQTHLGKDIDLILKVLFKNKDEERDDFITELKSLMSSYDPFDIDSDKLKILLKFLCRGECVELYNEIILYEFNNIIVESSDKIVQRNTLKKKLYEKRYLFRTIQFIIMIINNQYESLLKRDIASNTNLINIMAHEEGSKILDNTNTETDYYLLDINSISVDDDSLVHSSDTSVSSSSYNKKRQKAKAKAKADAEKERYIRYLLDKDGGDNCNNEIADEDSITFRNVRDLSMSKLRNIIRISHQVSHQENKKTYCYLFDARALYNDWKRQYYSNQQFKLKHPITRDEFTPEQLNDILFAARKRDFRIKDKDNEEKVNAPNARHDIEYIFSKQNDSGYYIITLFYTINVNFKDGKVGLIVDKIDKSDKSGKQREYRIQLIKIEISKKIPLPLHEKYSVKKLSDKIYTMYNNNEILGKIMPFKIHPAFDNYNMQKIEHLNEYRGFYNMVFKQYE
jgi:hypothetical protein